MSFITVTEYETRDEVLINTNHIVAIVPVGKNEQIHANIIFCGPNHPLEVMEMVETLRMMIANIR